jgi:hypothetical protein
MNGLGHRIRGEQATEEEKMHQDSLSTRSVELSTARRRAVAIRAVF